MKFVRTAHNRDGQSEAVAVMCCYGIDELSDGEARDARTTMYAAQVCDKVNHVHFTVLLAEIPEDLESSRTVAPIGRRIIETECDRSCRCGTTTLDDSTLSAVAGATLTFLDLMPVPKRLTPVVPAD